MKLPSYPRYKKSGVEWLANIPDHWEVHKIRRLFRFKSGGTPDTGNESFWDGRIPWASAKDMLSLTLLDTQDHITEEAVARSATTLVPMGTVLLVSRSGILRHSLPVSVAKRDVSINQDLKGFLTLGKINPDYFAYLIHGNQEPLLALWRQQGATVESLDFEAVKGSDIPLPSFAEQTTMVSFLNIQTQRIDTLIRKKEELIEKLQEKRSALISRVVTQGLPPDAAKATGLNPHPKMKDPGIEWLGEIPEHWEVKRLKFLSPKITVGIVVEPSKYYVDSGVPCLRSLNVKPHRIIEEDLVYISPESNELLAKSKIYTGDLVAVRSGQTGATAIVNERFDGANCIDLIIIDALKEWVRISSTIS